MDKTTELIDRLSRSLKAVRPIQLSRLLGLWLVIALAIAGYFLNSVGMRPDLSAKLGHADFVLGFLLYVEVFVLASWLVLRLAVPGREPAQMIRQALILGISASLAILFYAGVEEWTMKSLMHFDGLAALGCCLRISFGAILPATILTLISQYLAPAKIRAMSAAIWLAAASLVSIVSQMNCPIDGLSHVVVGHGILLVLTGLVGWGSFVLLSWIAARVVTRVRSNRVK